MLAAAELLVRGGERVGLLGLTQPTASRKAATRIAEAIARASGADAALQRAACRRKARLARFSGAILFSDFLDPVEDDRARTRSAGRRRRHRPPGAGRSIRPRRRCPTRAARSSSAPKAASAGSPIASRAARRTTRSGSPRIAPSSSELATRLGWSFLVHHTDRPAAEPLLTLIMRLQGGAGDYRWQSQEPAAAPTRGAAMSFGALAFLNPWLLAALAGAARHLLAAAHRAAAPAPGRLPADAHPGRPREPGEDAGQDAVVADADPHAGRRAASSWRSPSRCSIPIARRRSKGTGPVVLVVDNGWAAAAALGRAHCA